MLLIFSQEEQHSMLGSGFKAERLRVNLRLVINRLKLLEKKKSEWCMLALLFFFLEYMVES